jgi:hypothetical protein
MKNEKYSFHLFWVLFFAVPKKILKRTSKRIQKENIRQKYL